MATETVQTTQSKQPGKQEFKQEVSTETPDGTHHEIRYEYKVESKPEPAAASPYARIAMADAIVSRNVLWALGAGIVPIPLVDVVAVMGIEIKMLKELSDLYGVGFRYPLHDPRIDLMIWAEQTGVHGGHDGGVVGACIGMACERKELDGLL